MTAETVPITQTVLPDRMRDPQQRCLLMGILNVTPDSFSDGGRHDSVEAALRHARRMIAEGADIIDVGGESTRPGAATVSREEERRRVLPVISALRRETDVPISIDTRNACTARAAIAEGAGIINDISALRHDAEMAATAAAAGVPVVLMHMQGDPATMQRKPEYADVLAELRRFFEERIAFALEQGIGQIVLDPGIGFGKTLEHNLRLLRELAAFGDLGHPVLVGTSRKSFIGALTGADTEHRLAGSIASGLLAWREGAGILRVHDVGAMRDALTVAEAIAGQAGRERAAVPRNGGGQGGAHAV